MTCMVLSTDSSAFNVVDACCFSLLSDLANSDERNNYLSTIRWWYCNRMSRHRKHSQSPDVPSILIKGTLTGAVATLVLIPVFRLILGELAAVHRSLSPTGGPFSQELSTIFFIGNVSFVLLPLASTLGSILFAYSNLGIAGVVLYLMLSSAATGMILGSAMAMLTFVFGAVAIMAVWAIKSSQQRGRGVPTRRGRY